MRATSVLPPVAIASFDPSLARYVTHVTAGVPVRVVAVPSFDPTTILDDSLSAAAVRLSGIIWAVTVTVPVLLAAYLMLRRLRRRLARETRTIRSWRGDMRNARFVSWRLIPVNRTVRSTGPINTVREGPRQRFARSYNPRSACVDDPEKHIAGNAFDRRAANRGEAERVLETRLWTADGRIDAGGSPAKELFG